MYLLSPRALLGTSPARLRRAALADSIQSLAATRCPLFYPLIAPAALVFTHYASPFHEDTIRPITHICMASIHPPARPPISIPSEQRSTYIIEGRLLSAMASFHCLTTSFSRASSPAFLFPLDLYYAYAVQRRLLITSCDSICATWLRRPAALQIGGSPALSSFTASPSAADAIRRALMHIPHWSLYAQSQRTIHCPRSGPVCASISL